MTLVSYSDSEDSSVEEKRTPAFKLPAPKHSKPAIQKVVDRSDSGKIRISLPEVDSSAQKVEDSLNGPPAKRPRLGGEGGGIVSFNSFLPAPKRIAPIKSATQRGLGKGVNLKTGATPGFSRESLETTTPNEDISEVAGQGDNGFIDESRVPSNAETNSDKPMSNDLTVDTTMKKPATMFKPLSVTRKPAKKKSATPAVLPVSASLESNAENKAEAKVSLFSMGEHEEQATAFSKPSTDAQPYSYEIIRELETGEEDSPNLHGYEEPIPEIPKSHTSLPNDESGAQSLDSIATDLNLSASARRQLLGRGKQNGVATNVVNFNTDQEYAANEALRQAGEVQTHNPVRAIASGKHSLKQLVNAATNQKDALEEQFASGRRNKKEAGNKYGW